MLAPGAGSTSVTVEHLQPENHGQLPISAFWQMNRHGLAVQTTTWNPVSALPGAPPRQPGAVEPGSLPGLLPPLKRHSCPGLEQSTSAAGHGKCSAGAEQRTALLIGPHSVKPVCLVPAWPRFPDQVSIRSGRVCPLPCALPEWRWPAVRFVSRLLPLPELAPNTKKDKHDRQRHQSNCDLHCLSCLTSHPCPGHCPHYVLRP